MTEKTPSRKTITKLSNDPSKIEEIAFLEEIAESIPDCAYLKDFFAPELIGWAVSQIKSDFPPHAYDWLNKAGEVSELKREINQKDVNIERQAQEINDLTDSVDHLNEQVRRQSKDAVETEDALSAALRELDSANHKREGLKAQLSYKDQEIIKLKAALFDLIAPENLR